MAGGKHLEMESRCNSLLPTMRGPVKLAWGFKASSFRYHPLWKISFIPNASFIQASQVKIKQGLRRGDSDSEICTDWGGRVVMSHHPPTPTPSCHPELSKYPLPVTYSLPGPDDMCKYLFSMWYPKTESINLISCGFHCLVATA